MSCKEYESNDGVTVCGVFWILLQKTEKSYHRPQDGRYPGKYLKLGTSLIQSRKAINSKNTIGMI